jgi:hypothetical protein
MITRKRGLAAIVCMWWGRLTPEVAVIRGRRLSPIFGWWWSIPPKFGRSRWTSSVVMFPPVVPWRGWGFSTIVWLSIIMFTAIVLRRVGLACIVWRWAVVGGRKPRAGGGTSRTKVVVSFPSRWGHRGWYFAWFAPIGRVITRGRIVRSATWTSWGDFAFGDSGTPIEVLAMFHQVVFCELGP